MTIAQMHVGVNLGLQRIASHVFEEFLPEEIDTYLNNAITKFVKARLDTYEENQKAAEDLRTLIILNHEVDPIGSITVALHGFTADEITFPANYYYLISSRSRVAYNKDNIDLTGVAAGTIRIPVGSYTPYVRLNKLAQKDDLFQLLRDPFNKPTYKTPLAVLTSTGLRIYSNATYSVIKVYLDYIKAPATVALDITDPYTAHVNCDLPEHTHQEIVDICVSLMRVDNPPS